MSQMTGDFKGNKKFTSACKDEALNVLSDWTKNINCYYDGSDFSRRDFVLQANHSWGPCSCCWTKEHFNNLKSALRKVGATNIIGKFDYNYVDIAFDIKDSAIAQYKEA